MISKTPIHGAEIWDKYPSNRYSHHGGRDLEELASYLEAEGKKVVFSGMEKVYNLVLNVCELRPHVVCEIDDTCQPPPEQA